MHGAIVVDNGERDTGRGGGRVSTQETESIAELGIAFAAALENWRVAAARKEPRAAPLL